MRSIPDLRSTNDRLTPIEGNVPNLTELPSGCSFHPRCPHATDVCRDYDPELREVEPNRLAACVHARGYGNVDDSARADEPAGTARADGGEGQ
jgi:oligopeptide/dipeptide ABC transporter ATP-binding protein